MEGTSKLSCSFVTAHSIFTVLQALGARDFSSSLSGLSQAWSTHAARYFEFLPYVIKRTCGYVKLPLKLYFFFVFSFLGSFRWGTMWFSWKCFQIRRTFSWLAADVNDANLHLEKWMFASEDVVKEWENSIQRHWTFTKSGSLPCSVRLVIFGSKESKNRLFRWLGSPSTDG